MQEQTKLPRTSDILQEVLENAAERDDISVGEFMEALGGRAFGIAILIFSLPNSLPILGIPGFSAITAAPIILIGLQMLLGRPKLRLPRKISNYRFSAKRLASIMLPGLKYVRKMEKLFKPRLAFLTRKTAESFVGFVIMALGIILALPIPFGNFLPGFAISMIAMGFTERDGLVVLLGIICGVLASCIILGTVFVGAESLYHLLGDWFSEP